MSKLICDDVAVASLPDAQKLPVSLLLFQYEHLDVWWEEIMDERM